LLHLGTQKSTITMRSLAVLIAALCLVIAAPVMAVEDWRMLQEDSFEPSMAPLVDGTSFVPTLTGAPSLAEVGGLESAPPTAEPTSGSFKTATAVAGAATLCAFAGIF
jgi:hypothetical protein